MSTKFTKDHEYLTEDGTVGITHYAQNQLGDIVFVELPKVGQKLKQGDEAAVVESVKAASEIYSPVSGTVTAVNDSLTGDPGLINSDPSGTGWIFKMTIDAPGERDTLLDDAAYEELTK
jgi:glycine cleavage system H protein